MKSLLTGSRNKNRGDTAGCTFLAFLPPARWVRVQPPGSPLGWESPTSQLWQLLPSARHETRGILCGETPQSKPSPRSGPLRQGKDRGPALAMDTANHARPCPGPTSSWQAQSGNFLHLAHQQRPRHRRQTPCEFPIPVRRAKSAFPIPCGGRVTVRDPVGLHWWDIRKTTAAPFVNQPPSAQRIPLSSHLLLPQ